MAQNLQPALNIFADVILHPSFPDDQFKILKTQRLSQINNEKADPNEVVARVLPKLLYGKDHPYGMPGSGAGYIESVSNLLKADLIQWHDNWFKPNNGVIIVTGNINMKQLLPALEKAFGTWKPGDVPAKNTALVAATSGRKVYLVDKPGATQSVIVAAQLSVPPGQPNEAAIETFMRNFGGMSTSRLNRNLRLDKHWSYGSFAFLNAAKTQRTLAIVAPVQTDKTKESMIEVNKEIKNVAGEKLLEGEEYESIMRNMKLRLPARFSTLQALENAAVMLYNYKLPVDYWDTYPGKVNALTASELNAASKSVVHPQEMIWLIIGDLQKVQPGIAELNYGEVIQLDADGNQLSTKK
jgi:zinc protease